MLALSASSWRGAAALRAHRLWLGLCRSAGTGASSRLDPGQMLEHDSVLLACTCGVMERLHTSLCLRLETLSLVCETKPRRQITCLTHWLHVNASRQDGEVVGLQSLGVEQQGTTLLFPVDSRCGDVAGFRPGRHPDETKFQWKLNFKKKN